MADTTLSNETARLAALQRQHVLDTPPEMPFERITALLKSVLGVPMTAVSLIDTDRQWFKSRQGIDAEQTARDISFCTYTIRTDDPMVVNDASIDPRFADNPLVTGAPFIASYAGVPLRTHDGYNIGALCAIDVVPREFTAAQIEILKSFAELVMGEMQLRHIADRDHLTGALCRRAFIEEVDRALAEQERHRHPSGLVMFDIDHFKKINDRHGHAAGDAALRAVSARIAAMLRPGDMLGRLGGEEFAVLLANTDGAGAMVAAERFRSGLAAMIVANDPPLRLTASFGVAGTSGTTPTSEGWIAAADKALYRAKNDGRNRCRSADGFDQLAAA